MPQEGFRTSISENDHSQDDEVILGENPSEKGEEEEFNFDSNVLDTNDGAGFYS